MIQHLLKFYENIKPNAAESSTAAKFKMARSVHYILLHDSLNKSEQTKLVHSSTRSYTEVTRLVVNYMDGKIHPQLKKNPPTNLKVFLGVAWYVSVLEK